MYIVQCHIPEQGRRKEPYRSTPLAEMTTFRRFFKGLNLEGMDSHVLRPMITTFCSLGSDEGVSPVVTIILDQYPSALIGGKIRHTSSKVLHFAW